MPLRRLWPRRWENDQRLYDPAGVVEIDQEAEVENWADAHDHATVQVWVRYTRRWTPGRHCPTCGVTRTARVDDIETFERGSLPDPAAALRTVRDLLTGMALAFGIGSWHFGAGWAPTLALAILSAIAWGAYATTTTRDGESGGG